MLQKLRQGLVFSLVISMLSGCVSAKYKMAAEDTPPLVPLNLSAVDHDVHARVETVIFYAGPGSWKREAYWDEYLLSITNHGEQPVELQSATLIDFQGNPVIAGDEPWNLQEESREWIENYDSGTTGVVIKTGAASIMTGAALGGGLAALSASSASAMGASGAALGGMFAGAMIIVVAPFAILGTISVNVEARKQIEDEFQRLRLRLPAAINPNQATQGSLFFRITPGPQRLILLFTGFDVSVDLTSLSDLHIDTKAEAKQAE